MFREEQFREGGHVIAALSIGFCLWVTVKLARSQWIVSFFPSRLDCLRDLPHSFLGQVVFEVVEEINDFIIATDNVRPETANNSKLHVSVYERPLAHIHRAFAVTRVTKRRSARRRRVLENGGWRRETAQTYFFLNFLIGSRMLYCCQHLKKLMIWVLLCSM